MRHSHLHITVCLLIWLLPAAAGAAWIGNIDLEFEPGSHLYNGQRAHVTFDYQADEDVRFWVLPVYDEEVVPGYTWSGSAVHPAGAGSLTTWWRHPDGASVSHYRIRMMSADWSTELLAIDVPVWYEIQPEGVWNVRYSDATSGHFAYGHQFEVSFDGYTERAEGVLVFIRPFTDGALTPGYGASSASIPAGGGSDSSWFRFSSGPAHVDQLRFQVKSWDQTELLLEFFVPVDLHWGPLGFNDVVLDPPPPALLPHMHHVDVTCDYETAGTADVSFYAQPRLDGTTAPGYVYQAPIVLPPPDGSVTRWFTIMSMGDEVDAVRMRLYEDGGEALEAVQDAEYHFAANALWNGRHLIEGPAVMTALEHITMDVNYACDDPAGCRIWCRPVGDGIGFTDFYFSPSPVYPTGEGTAQVFCSLKEGVSALVEGLYVYMKGETDDSVLASWTFPAHHFYYSPALVVGVSEESPDAPTLTDAFPNPFNPSTTLAFTLPAAGTVRLDVYDVTGRRVRRLLDGPAAAGRNEVVWDGRDDAGRALASGAYLARLTAPRAAPSTRRLTLVR